MSAVTIFALRSAAVVVGLLAFAWVVEKILIIFDDWVFVKRSDVKQRIKESYANGYADAVNFCDDIKDWRP